MDLTAYAGLPLVVETLLATRMPELVRQRLRLRRRQRGFDEFDKLQAIVVLLAARGERVEDVQRLRDDAALSRLIEREIPSPDSLLDFLRAFHDETRMTPRPARGAFIPDESEALQALAAINAEFVCRAVGPRAPRRATLDLDATIIECHRREALAHYKQGRGYQPTAVLWVEEDLVVADQFRDGNVPAQLRALEVARRGFESLPPTVTERYFRGDTACYETELLQWLCRERIGFTISATVSQELRAQCTDARVRWQLLEDRYSDVLDWAEIEFTSGSWPRRAQPLRYIALRSTARQGRLFSDGQEVRYHAIASNRHEHTAPELVHWHWLKGGTIEHLHDVTKNELGGRLPPSATFGANAAWYRLNLLTYNVLTTLKRAALPERLHAARPRRLRYELFTIPAKLSDHARALTAKLGTDELTVAELVAARGRLRALHDAVGAFLDERAP